MDRVTSAVEDVFYCKNGCLHVTLNAQLMFDAKNRNGTYQHLTDLVSSLESIISETKAPKLRLIKSSKCDHSISASK